jgi:hypothetical protein
MRDNEVWLCQGDIFESAPVLDVQVDPAGGLVTSLGYGPAVLLTHDCAMDKAEPDGSPKAERLQFARLRIASRTVTTVQANDLRGRRGKTGPFEVLWISDVRPFGECLIFLSDPYFVPLSYFDAAMVQYNVTEADGNPSAPRATPRANDTRMGRLEEGQIDLLRLKMLAFWTRLKPSTTPTA